MPSQIKNENIEHFFWFFLQKEVLRLNGLKQIVQGQGIPVLALFALNLVLARIL